MNTKLKPFKHNHNSNKFPNITKPKIIGYFSLNEKREYVPDCSNLKYLRLPNRNTPIKFNLNDGYDIVKPKPNVDERIDFLLKFILDNLTEVEHDFVCFRGLIRLIMCTPYEKRDGWSILATKWNNTIYLCGLETDKKKIEKQNETERSKMFCYYGFKYEQFLLTEDPTRSPNTEEPVVLAEEFCSMYSTYFEGCRVLYGAEMDGIIHEAKITDEINFNELEFVELKVKRRENNPRQLYNFYKFKAIKWWCQSFLVNIKKLFVGLRDDNGIVNEVQEMSVRELVKASESHWSSIVCMRFFIDFIQMVKSDMSNVNSPYTCYRYDFDPECDEFIKLSTLYDRNKFSFLPEWYISKRRKRNNLGGHDQGQHSS